MLKVESVSWFFFKSYNNQSTTFQGLFLKKAKNIFSNVKGTENSYVVKSFPDI